MSGKSFHNGLLPREIIDMIYENVLPAGLMLHVKIEATVDPSENPSYMFLHRGGAHSHSWQHLDMPVLCVSKQVFRDAIEYFYRANRVAFDLSYAFRIFRKFELCHRSSLHRIQHIVFRIDTYPVSFSKVTKGLKAIEDLIGVGQLRTATIEMRSSPGEIPVLIQLLSMYTQRRRSKVFSDFLDTLTKSCKNEKWGLIERKVWIDMHGSRETHVQDANEMVKQIHGAFGGELWINIGTYTLCYKDGKELSPPFEVKGDDEDCKKWKRGG